MQSYKLKIPPAGTIKDLTIIYQERNDKLYKLKASTDEVLKTLGYFTNKTNEIKLSKLIYVEENIDFCIFQSFISSISTNELDINNNNYQSFYYLSHKYGYEGLSRQIEEFAETRPDLALILTDLSQKLKNEDQADLIKNSIDFDKEELISKNIDVSIKNGLLKKLPLEMLNRILNSPKRVVKDHHLLFSFVIDVLRTKLNENLSEEEKENLLILPSSLDYCEMSNDEIDELFSIENFESFFNPRHSQEKMKSMISYEKKMMNKINEIEGKIKLLQGSQANNDKKYVEQQNIIEQIEQKTSQNKDSIENIIQNQNPAFKSSIEKLVQKTEQQSAELSEIQKMISSFRKVQSDVSLIKKEMNLDSIFCPNGIFKYLFDTYKVNPVENGIVKIEGKSHYSNEPFLIKIIEPNWNNGSWESSHDENSYIRIDFIKSFVRIKKYRLLVGHTNCDYYFTSWILTGITIDNKEITLDEVQNSKDITHNHQETIRYINSDTYLRSIKLTMKGKDSHGFYGMIMRNIELFGHLKTLDKTKTYIKKKYK